MITCAGIIIRRGKAYIPVDAIVEGGGPFVAIDPVIVTDLNPNAIATGLETIASYGHPTIPPISRDEWKLRKDPILCATGVKSWPKLAKDSASYSISWSNMSTIVYLHALDAKGRFSGEPARTKTLSANASMLEIAQVIVEDVQRLPTLGFVDVREG